MIRYVLRSFAAHVRSGRALFALGVLGVALGVASVQSIQILNLNAVGAFEGSVRAISGDADLSVVPRGPDLPEQTYVDVLSTEGVAAAWPVLRVEVALVRGDRGFLEIVGIDPFSAMRVPWSLSRQVQTEPIATPGWVAVSPRLADRLGLGPGTRFEVSSGSRRVTLQVGALVDFREISPLASDRLVVMDIAQAQHFFAARGKLDEIAVRVRDGADPATVARRLEDRIGPVARASTPVQRREEVTSLLGAFRLNLTALSLISVFVGAFLVFTSTQASLVRRRNELGLLRSIGATRGQVLLWVLAEVGLLGLLGVMVGLPLGRAVATYNLGFVSHTVTNLYLLEEIERLSVPAWVDVLATAVGLGAALAGAFLPALDMSRRDTRALLTAYSLQDRAARWAAPLAAAGCGLVVGAFVLVQTVGRPWRPAGFALAVALLLGLPALAPWVVRVATGHLRPRTFGLAYGARALAVRLVTTGFAVAALAVAVSMLVGVTLMVGSFRRTVEIWIGGTVRADVYVTTESWRRGRQTATLEDELVEALARFPGVRAIDRLRQFSVDSEGRRITLSGVDAGLDTSRTRFEMIRGDDVEALRRVHEEGAAIVGEPLARKAGLGVGDFLELSTPHGPTRVPVAGVAYDYGNERGGAVIDLDTMARLYGPGPVNNVALYLAPGTDPGRAIDALRRRFADRPLVIRSNADLRREVFRIFDQTFAVTRLLQVMGLLVAACGVMLTLLVLARERVSELALYRALGASRGQIFRVFLGKGLGIAALGLLLGGAGGVALAMILIFVINRAYFGWTIAVHWPWSSLGFEILAILFAALSASVPPALRASRTPAGELSRENL